MNLDILVLINKPKTGKKNCIMPKVDVGQHLEPNVFRKTNRNPRKRRVEKEIATNVFKYWKCIPLRYTT